MSKEEGKVVDGICYLAIGLLLFIGAGLESCGLEREPTNKDKLTTACVIHVDSVPKPETEGV